MSRTMLSSYRCFKQTVFDLESKIEDITRQTNLELSRNFITPFDREDIYLLITAIDTVAGNLNGAASRMKLYQVEKITKSIRKLVLRKTHLKLCYFVLCYIKV